MNFDIRGFSQGEVIFSNSVEVLFENLRVRLFIGDFNPFSQRILISPSQSMQQWIQLQLVSSLSVSAGITPLFLHQAVEKLIDLFFHETASFSPSQTELFLRLEDEIEKALNSSDPLWQPLNQYVKGKEARKIALATHLSKQFLRYGIYANQSVKSWETSPSNWQEALWAKIFGSWSYPLRRLLNLKPKPFEEKDISIHLFAFSHLSSLHFDFFCKIARNIPVYFYHLSPTQEFWSGFDLSMPHLLKHFGQVGRAMAKEFEESGLQSEEMYLEFGGDTQLKQLQKHLLHLDSSQPTLDDHSLQIHVATTPYREVEILHSNLQNLIQNSDVEPKDILVMAPNITTYFPYIKYFFEGCYQVADLPMQLTLPPAQALCLLLELDKHRWSAPAVLEVFDHPLLFKKQGFSEEDLLQIRKWVQQTGIRWGMDASHRDRLLKQSHCHKGVNDSVGTWMEGLGKLLEELAIARFPSRIDFADAELLGNLIQVLKNLYKDLQELDQAKTMQEWVSYLKRLVETYFVSSEETDTLFAKLDSLVKAACEKRYRFPLIYALVVEKIGSESITVNRQQIQAIRFCSMLPMRAIPAKVICLIGMNHDAFPRKDELKSLDLLQVSKCDYCPSRVDFDRSLFLEALLSAREKLIVSYLGRDPYDLSELPPSSVIAELLPYVSKNQIFHHTTHAYLEEENTSPSLLFSIQKKSQFSLPSGHFVIEAADLVRLCRSSLQHYLHAHKIKIREEDLSIKGEEDFILSPLQKYHPSSSEAFPLGMFKTLAEQQIASIQKDLIPKELSTYHFPPIDWSLSSSCSVSIVGSIEGVFEHGLYLPRKCDLKGAVKAWPLFLLLNHADKMKRSLLFAHSQKEKEAFFTEAKPYLLHLIEYYFFTREVPSPLIADWIEPILKQDARKLRSVTIYDPSLCWYLRGKPPLSAEHVISIWSPWVEKLYKEMADAWF